MKFKFPKLSKDMKFLTMGSCFAGEIRRYLMRNGLTVYPIYEPDGNRKIQEDRPRDLIWYTPNSILQEVLFWTSNIYEAMDKEYWDYGTRIQYPYRRMVLDHDKSALDKKIDHLDNVIKFGFDVADVFIFTFGHIESWLTMKGRCACLEPVTDIYKYAKFHLLSYKECLQIFIDIEHHIHLKKPSAILIYTLSPVPMLKTYRDMDVSIANCESKSILRAALSEFFNLKKENTYYFPSYEFVSRYGISALRDDNRHIKDDIIEAVVKDLFLKGSSWEI